jgi:hypothetical protein
VAVVVPATLQVEAAKPARTSDLDKRVLAAAADTV